MIGKKKGTSRRKRDVIVDVRHERTYDELGGKLGCCGVDRRCDVQQNGTERNRTEQNRTEQNAKRLRCES